MQIELNEQFKMALAILEDSRTNLFITGKAGSGKSTLLDYFVKNTKKDVVILAPTGVAALNVKGETIHSFFKFLPGVTTQIARQKGARAHKNKLYKNLDMIIIDEISMVRADLFDCIDIFLRESRKSKKPFGGVQMILIGDLYQLPPVVGREERDYFESQDYESPYFFSAKVMKSDRATDKNELDEKFVFLELEKVYRQRDEKFIKMLNAIRKKAVGESELFSFFNNRVKNLENDDGYIYLTSTNKAADAINEKKLANLEGELVAFSAEKDGDFTRDMAPTEVDLRLKKNAQIMLLTNNSDGDWVNGTVGHIVDFLEDGILVKKQDGKKILVETHEWILYKYNFDDKLKKLSKTEVGYFRQYPMKLAWGITIHKSQGKTFDKVVVDLESKTFATGQTYVALSRCSSLDGLILKRELRKEDILIDYRVINFLTKWQYSLAEKSISVEDKLEIIKRAVENGSQLNITYLKATDEKTKRIVKPITFGEMKFKSYEKTFIGMEAFCTVKQETRVFRIDRILEIAEC